MREDRFRNNSDLLDKTTFQEFKEINKSRLKNVEWLLENELTKREKEVLKIIKTFVEELTESFEWIFNDLIDEYQRRGNKFSSKLSMYLDESRTDIVNHKCPKFQIANGTKAKKLLTDLGLEEYEMDTETFIVNFQLPTPMAQWWWDHGGKSTCGTFYDDHMENNSVIGWGDMYRKCMQTVHGVYGYYENEKGLWLDRVNGLRQHDKERYYYVWEANI